MTSFSKDLHSRIFDYKIYETCRWMQNTNKFTMLIRTDNKTSKLGKLMLLLALFHSHFHTWERKKKISKLLSPIPPQAIPTIIDQDQLLLEQYIFLQEIIEWFKWLKKTTPRGSYQKQPFYGMTVTSALTPIPFLHTRPLHSSNKRLPANKQASDTGHILNH